MTAGNATSGAKLGGTIAPDETTHIEDSRNINGESRKMAIYHRFLVILLKSNIFQSRSFKPRFPCLRNVRIEADAMGVIVKKAI